MFDVDKDVYMGTNSVKASMGNFTTRTMAGRYWTDS